MGERRQDFINRGLADVHQHSGTPRCLGLIPLRLAGNTVKWPSTVVLLQNLLVRYRCHLFVVEFEPPSTPIRLDESEILFAAGTTGVYEHTVKLVLPGFCPVSRLVEEFFKIDFKGEFEAIVALRDRVRITPMTRRKSKYRVP